MTCYVCLFSCVSTHAVNLKLTCNLSLAFKRFTSRHGLPATLISDNAKRVQREILQGLLDQKKFTGIWPTMAWYGNILWKRLPGGEAFGSTSFKAWKDVWKNSLEDQHWVSKSLALWPVKSRQRSTPDHLLTSKMIRMVLALHYALLIWSMGVQLLQRQIASVAYAKRGGGKGREKSAKSGEKGREHLLSKPVFFHSVHHFLNLSDDVNCQYTTNHK